MPSGASVVGNDAFSRVRTTGFSGERRSRPRSSTSGWPDGMVVAGGAVKMVFSTFARVMVVKSASRAVMVMYIFANGCVLVVLSLDDALSV